MKKETGRPEGYRSAGNNKEANQMTSMERRDVEDEMLYQFSQVSTKDQYQKAVDAFNSMDDAQFEEFYTRYMEKAEKVTTWKEYHARVEEMRRANGVTEHNSALNSVYARFLDEEGNRELWSKINETNPSDRVTLTFDDIKQLNRLWHESTPAADAGTPADILISGSIPLTDMELSIKGKDSPIDTYRIVIFKNYQQIITENKAARVGALIIYLGPRQIACPLFVMHGINGINFVDDIGHIGLTEKMIREKKIAVNALLKMAGFVMNAVALFRENPDPTEEEIREYLAGNLCRCSGYEGQLRGIQAYLAWKKAGRPRTQAGDLGGELKEDRSGDPGGESEGDGSGNIAEGAEE